MPVTTEPTIDRGDTRTLTVQILVTDVLTDPGTLTLKIRTPAGVTTTYTYGVDVGLVRDGAGEYSYELTFTQSGAYTYEWRSTTPSQVQGETIQVTPSPLDIVAGTDAPYFTIGEARQLSPLGDESKYPDAAIDAARLLAESALEHACAVSFVPRAFTSTVNGNGGTDLLLPVVRPLTITSITVDGTALSVSALAGVGIYETGVLYNVTGWSIGRRNVVVVGTAGWPVVPPRVKRAALLLAKRYIVDSPQSDRATSMTTADGTVEYLVTAGVRQAVFDVPEANAIVNEYGMKSAYLVG